MPSAEDTAASETGRSHENGWEVFQQRSTGHSTSERTSASRCNPLPGPERPARRCWLTWGPTEQQELTRWELRAWRCGEPQEGELGRHAGYRLWQRIGCEGPEARNSKWQRTRPEPQKKASSRWTHDLYWKLWTTATRTSHCGLLGRERHDQFCISKRSFFWSTLHRQEGEDERQRRCESGWWMWRPGEESGSLKVFTFLTGTGGGRREGERSVAWLGLCPGRPDKQRNGAQGGGREQLDDLPVLDAENLRVSETPTQSWGKRASACIWSPGNGWDWAFRFGNQHTDGTPRTLKRGNIS